MPGDTDLLPQESWLLALVRYVLPRAGVARILPEKRFILPVPLETPERRVPCLRLPGRSPVPAPRPAPAVGTLRGAAPEGRRAAGAEPNSEFPGQIQPIAAQHCPTTSYPVQTSVAVTTPLLRWGADTQESRYHRMFGVGRDLCGSSSPTPLPKQGHLQQAAEDLVQADLEYLQRRRLHSLPGQPVPVLRQNALRMGSEPLASSASQAWRAVGMEWLLPVRGPHTAAMLGGM